MVRLWLFGSLRIEVGGCAAELPERRSARALLAWLALHPGLHTRSRVAGVFWPEVPEEDARTSLRTALAAIRRSLRDAATECLIATREEIGLAQRDDVWVDVVDFRLRLGRGELEQATELASGELLQDLDYEWVHEARDDHRRLLEGALSRLATAAERSGDLRVAIELTRRQVTCDPLAEEPNRELVRRLASAGDRAAALSAYDTLRQRLRSELALAPSAETVALAESLLRGSDPSAASGSSRPGTAYARCGELNIAYQVIGDGPVDLVWIPSWFSNVEVMWEEPRYARFLERLGSISRLIVFDPRGGGLSDPIPYTPVLEQRVEDTLAVMAAVGSPRPVLLGNMAAGAAAVLFAVTHPDRVRGMILHGAYARRAPGPDYPWGRTVDSMADVVRKNWGKLPIGLDVITPSVTDDPAFCRWLLRYQRLAVSPGAAGALVDITAGLDVRDLLPSVRAPTLVLHRVGDRMVEVAHGRYLAEHIPDARLVELRGEDNWPLLGDSEAVAARIERFLGELG